MEFKRSEYIEHLNNVFFSNIDDDKWKISKKVLERFFGRLPNELIIPPQRMMITDVLLFLNKITKFETWYYNDNYTYLYLVAPGKASFKFDKKSSQIVSFRIDEYDKRYDIMFLFKIFKTTFIFDIFKGQMKYTDDYRIWRSQMIKDGRYYVDSNGECKPKTKYVEKDDEDEI